MPLLLLLLLLLAVLLLIVLDGMLLLLLLLLALPPGRGAGIARNIGAEATGYRTTLQAAAGTTSAIRVEPGSSRYGQ